MTSISRNAPFGALALALAALATIPLTPMALAQKTAQDQSLVVEGLQLMLDEVTSDSMAQRVEDFARTIHEELTVEVDELQALQNAADGPDFLVYDGAGNAATVSEQSVRDRAAGLALEMATSDDPYAYFMGLLARGERLGGADQLIANTMLLVLDEVFPRDGDILTLEPGDLEPLIADIMLDQFLAANEEGHELLAQQISDLHRQRDAVWAILEAADNFDFVSLEVPDVPVGIMNEPGYWVVQYSGSGWHKGGSGYATRITGYENIIIQITDEVAEPTSTRWYWQLPPGYDLLRHERLRQEAAEESSRENCASLPVLGPRAPSPSIWSDGPHYEIVEGPITDWAEALAVRGNSRLNNNDPAGSRFWHHESGLRYEDLDPTCERYGVSLVD